MILLSSSIFWKSFYCHPPRPPTPVPPAQNAPRGIPIENPLPLPFVVLPDWVVIIICSPEESHDNTSTLPLSESPKVTSRFSGVAFGLFHTCTCTYIFHLSDIVARLGMRSTLSFSAIIIWTVALILEYISLLMVGMSIFAV